MRVSKVSKAIVQLWLILALLTGCSGWPGGTFSYTFPFTVSVNIPAVPGPVPVVLAANTAYAKPALEVPFNVAAVSPKTTVVKATATSPKMTVRVVAANINTPRLVVPKQKLSISDLP